MDQTFRKPKVIVYRFVDVIITAGRLKFDYVNITSEYLAKFIDEFYAEPELIQLLTDLRDMSVDDYERTFRRCPLIFKSSQTKSAVRVS